MIGKKISCGIQNRPVLIYFVLISLIISCLNSRIYVYAENGNSTDEENILKNPWIVPGEGDTGYMCYDVVEFGSYPQTDPKGQTKDPIKWRVMDVGENDVLLWADSILDYRMFDSIQQDSKCWDTCELRTWLQGEFVETAFNKEEQEAICPVNHLVDYPESEEYAVVEDTVFLPDMQELYAMNYAGTDTWYIIKERAILYWRYATAYSHMQLCRYGSEGLDGYWFRTSGGQKGIYQYMRQEHPETFDEMSVFWNSSIDAPYVYLGICPMLYVSKDILLLENESIETTTIVPFDTYDPPYADTVWADDIEDAENTSYGDGGDGKTAEGGDETSGDSGNGENDVEGNTDSEADDGSNADGEDNTGGGNADSPETSDESNVGGEDNIGDGNVSDGGAGSDGSNAGGEDNTGGGNIDGGETGNTGSNVNGEHNTGDGNTDSGDTGSDGSNAGGEDKTGGVNTDNGENSSGNAGSGETDSGSDINTGNTGSGEKKNGNHTDEINSHSNAEDINGVGQQAASELKDIKSAVIGELAEQIYTGEELCPELGLTYNGKSLKRDEDYKVTFINNINSGIAYANVTGCGEYSGTASFAFAIQPRVIDGLNTILKGKDGTIYKAVYTGKSIRPKTSFRLPILVGEDIYRLSPEEGKDYTVSYANNRKIGIATITYRFYGNYNGIVTKEFQIVPGKVTKLAAKKSGNKTLLTWKKVKGASGYAIYRSSRKNGTYKLLGRIGNKSKYTDAKAKGKKYYYKVRAYGKQSGIRYYGETVSCRATGK